MNFMLNQQPSPGATARVIDIIETYIHNGSITEEEYAYLASLGEQGYAVLFDYIMVADHEARVAALHRGAVLDDVMDREKEQNLMLARTMKAVMELLEGFESIGGLLRELACRTERCDHPSCNASAMVFAYALDTFLRGPLYDLKRRWTKLYWDELAGEESFL